MSGTGRTQDRDRRRVVLAEPKPGRTLRVNLAASSVLALLLAGCGGGAKVGEARSLPEGLRQSETLDVQVYRDGTKLEMTNTTAQELSPGTLWVNQRYGRPFEGLGVGESAELPLTQFRNEYGEAFRAGGFFATEPPDLVVLTQLETDGTLYGLIVVGNRLE